MLKSPQFFRTLGWLEGGSLLLLVFLGMPLKYLYDFPTLVKVIGPIHGLLFTCYCLMLAEIHSRHRWQLSTTALFFSGALVPFGTFALDGKLRKLLNLNQ